ncbi:hypothetical protein ACFSQT_31955 [Mesorhizobium calcicola]|uniref:Hedgehog/Intein (Hint) domain-containing protein n=1 Tax=Mesorhizobium calcicola TaxID=1300310 RepID=A0ABW4WPK2_9HYPH
MAAVSGSDPFPETELHDDLPASYTCPSRVGALRPAITVDETSHATRLTPSHHVAASKGLFLSLDTGAVEARAVVSRAQARRTGWTR